MIPVQHSNLLPEHIRIDSKLGSGSSSSVYKAWHTGLNKYVVIKESRHTSVRAAGTRRNEAEALKKVRSAYVPQVLDFLTKKDRSFTVMELVEGDSIDKLLRRGAKFTETQVIRWYRQLASALEAIHRRNICHCDIKPANIMLTPAGDVCLIDFSAAMVGTNDTKLIARSPGYASPEQYAAYQNLISFRAGQGTFIAFPSTLIHSIDWKRSDIYSLGAAMYHLLTGTHPPETAGEVVPLSKLGYYDEGSIYIIERSMSIDPVLRFASASALSHALRSIFLATPR